MPFDPAKPAANSPLASAEMRAQLTALNSDIQTRTTANDLNSAVASALGQTSANTNSVSTLSMSADGVYNQMQFQQMIDKIDELINTARRT